MKTEKDCYGRMFPTIIAMTHDKPAAGKVFGYEVSYQGQVAAARGATADREAWQQCLHCPEFDGCYRLSAGVLLMELGVKTSPSTLF